MVLLYCFKDSLLHPNLESLAWMRFFIMNSHHICQVSLRQRIFCSNQTKHNCLKQYDNIYLHQKLLNWRQFHRLIIMSLMVRLKWKERSTYRSIAEMYASFTVDNYGKATVVCDGYTGRPSTKDNAHQRRCPQVTNRLIYQLQHNLLEKRGLPCK